MNTTPKAQDGEDGVAAAHGSRPSLEQTVLGVAPPAGAASPTASPEEAHGSPATEPTSAPPSVGGTAQAGAALVAAPTIAVSDRAEAAAAHPSTEPVLAGPAEPQARAEAFSNPGSTLPLPPPAVEAALPLQPAQQVEAAAVLPPAAGQQQRTELSSDYLRAARDAALNQVAASATASARRVDPTPAPMPVGPALQGEAEEERLRPAPLSRTMDSSLGSGTRPSIAPPYGAPPPSNGEQPPSAGRPSSRGFEPVPVLRAPLAESLSSALGPLAELGGSRNLLAPSTRPLPPVPRRREASSRWLLLGSVALATVGVVSLGERLLTRYRISRARELAVPVATAPSSSTGEAAPTLDLPLGASSALLANRPAADRGGPVGPVRVISATGGGSQNASGAATSAGASPESQLAATAGRHVLSGNYAEALPVYQQLLRTYPENTAYAAMARLLGEKLASSHDTRTVTPTSVTPKSASPRGAGAK